MLELVQIINLIKVLLIKPLSPDWLEAYKISRDTSASPDVLYATLIAVDIGPPMSDMSLLSVSMHLSFKHQPVINQTANCSYTYAVSNDRN